jgi:hypothetical protein
MPKWLSTAGNQFNSWGFPQVPYSGTGLYRTITIFFQFFVFATKPPGLGLANPETLHSGKLQE